MDKIEALKSVLDNPARPESERAAARQALEQLHSANQPQQDSELELWFSCGNAHDLSEARKNFSPESKQLLDDYCSALMGFADLNKSACAARLMALYERTHSPIVREKFLPLLRDFALYAPESSVRHGVQDFLVSQGANKLEDFVPLLHFIAVLERSVQSNEPDPKGIIAERLKSALATRKLPPDRQKVYGRSEMER